MSLCSLDTNILLHAANEDAPEHGACKDLLQQVIEHAAEWVIADQVYLELYRAPRNPRVISAPLPAKAALRLCPTGRRGQRTLPIGKPNRRAGKAGRQCDQF